MTDETTPALLKDILGPQALTIIADAGGSVSPRFDRASFLSAASEGLDALSIMERVRHIADALHVALPARYEDALEIIRAMAPQLTHGFQVVAVTEFVAQYGLGVFDRSLDALTDLTRFPNGGLHASILQLTSASWRASPPPKGPAALANAASKSSMSSRFIVLSRLMLTDLPNRAWLACQASRKVRTTKNLQIDRNNVATPI